MSMKMNPDNTIIEKVVNKLIENKKKYGKEYCPSKLERIDDNICPCKEKREKEICECGFFVKEALDERIDKILTEQREKENKKRFTSTEKKKFKGTIIITDPCYIIKDDDWKRSGYGEFFDKLGINTFLSHETIYGDWSCTTVNKDTNKSLGEFCADAGMVCVVLKEELDKYNPDWNKTLEYWCYTEIPDFDGEISIEVQNYKDKKESFENKFVSVIGSGNINFYTSQTGI